MLLANDGRGRFTDVTEAVAPDLAEVGMVTDALWEDMDGDGRADLVLVGEWMPITAFRNTGGRLAPMALASPKRGWRLAFLTTVASVLGGIAGYAIGWLARFFLSPLWPY